MEEHKHGIVILTNKNNELLQYYDNKWDSLLFLNYKLQDSDTEYIKKSVSEEFDISVDSIEVEYIMDKVHTKFSQGAKMEKLYHHFFYKVNISSMPEFMNAKKFCVNKKDYEWCSIDELEKNKRVMEVNSDIVGYVKNILI